jgi:hypothetical protein
MLIHQRLRSIMNRVCNQRCVRELMMKASSLKQIAIFICILDVSRGIPYDWTPVLTR